MSVKRNKLNVPLTQSLKFQKQSKYISVRFAYLTENKRRNFDFFGKNLREKEQAYNHFFELLREITSHTRIDLALRNRKQFGGFEMLNYNFVSCKPSNYSLQKDADIAVFVFGMDYRLLAFFDDDDGSVLNIIGFDFEHGAYDHD